MCWPHRRPDSHDRPGTAVPSSLAPPIRCRQGKRAACCSSRRRETQGRDNESQEQDRSSIRLGGPCVGLRFRGRIRGKPTAERLRRSRRWRTSDPRLHAPGWPQRRRGIWWLLGNRRIHAGERKLGSEHRRAFALRSRGHRIGSDRRSTHGHDRVWISHGKNAFHKRRGRHRLTRIWQQPNERPCLSGFLGRRYLGDRDVKRRRARSYRGPRRVDAHRSAHSAPRPATGPALSDR
jgi:hypothetical protein